MSTTLVLESGPFVAKLIVPLVLLPITGSSLILLFSHFSFIEELPGNTEVDKRYHLLKQKKKENLICRTEGQIQAQLWTRRSGWRNRPVQDRRTGRYQEAPGTDSPLRRTCKEKDKTWPPTWMLIGVSLMSVRKSTVKISGAVPVGGRLDDDINTWGPFFLWPFLKYSELKWVKQIEGHERAVHLMARLPCTVVQTAHWCCFESRAGGPGLGEAGYKLYESL